MAGGGLERLQTLNACAIRSQKYQQADYTARFVRLGNCFQGHDNGHLATQLLLHRPARALSAPDHELVSIGAEPMRVR
jgi:hypothetical protein